MQSGQNLKRIYQKQFVINERNENLMSNEKMNESLPAVASKTFDLSKEFSTVAEGEGSMIRTSTTDDDVTLFNAINSSAEKLEEYIDQEVEVVAIVVTSADVAEDMNDEDSNKVNKPVVHFFCKDGKHISSISNGIRRATENLLSVGFAPSIESPITLKFKLVKTKKGTAHSFDLVKR